MAILTIYQFAAAAAQAHEHNLEHAAVFLTRILNGEPGSADILQMSSFAYSCFGAGGGDAKDLLEPRIFRT